MPEPIGGDRPRKRLGDAERGSAVIEFIFCAIFIFLLIAFVVQLVEFIIDYNKAADQVYYDLLETTRFNEHLFDTKTVDLQSDPITLRDVPLLRSMLDLDTGAIPPKFVKMSAVGGTYARGSGFAYDAADNPAGPNWWQPLYSNPVQKGAIMLAAAGIGFRF